MSNRLQGCARSSDCWHRSSSKWYKPHAAIETSAIARVEGQLDFRKVVGSCRALATIVERFNLQPTTAVRAYSPGSAIAAALSRTMPSQAASRLVPSTEPSRLPKLEGQLSPVRYPKPASLLPAHLEPTSHFGYTTALGKGQDRAECRLLGSHSLAVAEAPSAAGASTASGTNRSRPAEANVGMLDR